VLVECPVDPWIIHLRIVVLINSMGIIWIEVFGAKLTLHYFLSSKIHIFQALNLVQFDPQRKGGLWCFILPM